MKQIEVQSKDYEQQIIKIQQENHELKKHNQIKEVMLQISYSIMNIENMDELMKVIVDSAVTIVDHADTASILIRNDEDLFEFKAVHGFDWNTISRIKLPIEQTFLKTWPDHNYCRGRIIDQPMEFNCTHMSKEHFKAMENARGLEIQSTICTPIIIDDRIYGLLNVDNTHQHNIFSQEDILIMEYLTSQLSLALKNVMLLEKTIFLSRYDGLTKVYHRHYFDELFQSLYKRAGRYHEEFCLCIMDLDNLKHINDIYGHAAGDLAIEHFAKVLKHSIRESDLLGRYGGDEFVIVFLNAQYEDVQSKILSISQMIRNTPLEYHGFPLPIEFSYGIACYPADTINDKELYKIADYRMYANKVYPKGTK